LSKIETFAVWAPVDVMEKAQNPNGGDSEPMIGRIGGIVSAQTVDQQNETLSQDGVDWSYFLSKGWFNYEHEKGPDNVLGHPERVVNAEINGKPATRVEGVLYLAKAKARDVFETAQAMKKAGGARQLGFSVEGQVLERDPTDNKKIKKSRVLNVALTAHPVHPDARLEVLARSLTFEKSGGTVGYQYPSMANDGGSLSPLIPQSIEAMPAIATYGVSAYKKKTMSVQELAVVLSTTFPALNYGQALSMATEIARSIG
jgi:hypothetical protein